MNEAVIEQAGPDSRFSGRVFGSKRKRKSAAFYGYSLTIIALGIGWLIRDRGLITAESGIGYWLGIIGGSMMLILLLYPLRKRFKLLRFLGGIPEWFKLHMVLGVVGPVLVLYHSNFQLGSFNSQIALYCMLLVAGSGLVGRYIYAGIHRGLYGGKTSLSDLQKEVSQSLEKSHGLASLMPKFTKELERVSTEVQGDAISGSMGIFNSLSWTVKGYVEWWSLRRLALTELGACAAQSPTVSRDYDRLKRLSLTYVRNFVRLNRRIAQFTLYEKLFSIWHIAHLPLFYMMVISALVHVLAVHMY